MRKPPRTTTRRGDGNVAVITLTINDTMVTARDGQSLLDIIREQGIELLGNHIWHECTPIEVCSSLDGVWMCRLFTGIIASCKGPGNSHSRFHRFYFQVVGKGCPDQVRPNLDERESPVAFFRP